MDLPIICMNVPKFINNSIYVNRYLYTILWMINLESTSTHFNWENIYNKILDICDNTNT